MTRSPETRAHLLSFLKTIVKPAGALEDVDDSVNLFDAGYLDSLATIQIILYLEQNHGLKLSAHGVDPADLGSIGGILSAIERCSP